MITFLQLEPPRRLVRIRLSSNGSYPSGISVDDGTPYGRPLNQTKILSRSTGQTSTDGLTGRHDQPVLAWLTSDLIEFSLDDRSKAYGGRDTG